ncbi:hypothetical protein A2164_01995 [Candidatus Curtissbacteria bacterium RBG_13_35_7]|uniref:Glycosyl transferase family 1 domain-containing protein n=1 Tax=Candidatus Curtissbacteria bacterium RBG_13_35_7 TaxID=1797705 RepID=A0A1F5G2U4_9BACT|nr:MAG: hypothetical protein A2164_01995 [Candidatus Curtissbacteria bacterium RBG_13_35_7]
MEALSCGCAVIASDIGPHREIFDNILPNSNNQTPNSKITGSQRLAEAMILTKPNDINKWSSFLYQYITMYNNIQTSILNKSKNDRIRHELTSIYSWENTAKLTLQVFEHLRLK